MAHRDRSQGFGFVYLDLAKFISERDELEKKHLPYPPLDVPTVNFNKDAQNPASPASIVPLRPSVPAANPRGEAIAQIRENLDRLQTLHHKLHAMLEELNTITAREKKKSDEK